MPDLNFTFGMPPSTHVSDHMMRNTMLVAELTPCEPKFTLGETVFELEEKTADYLRLLESHGFTHPSGKLKVAFLADNFPTDTFTNNYGETFLDKFASAASGAVSDVSQMLGAKTLGEGGKAVIGALSQAMPTVGSYAQSGLTRLQDMQKNVDAAMKNKNYSGIKGILQTASAVAAGGRIDFPQVWKDSSFQPSYTMTIRLYNPAPGDIAATEKYMIGPIAALLLLGLPRITEGANSYSWPFLVKVKAPGIYNLVAAYINNIAVVKGGDQQSIGWNQVLGVVDIRLDIGTLYSTALVEDPNKVGQMIEQRPTLAGYLDALRMKGDKIVEDPYVEEADASFMAQSTGNDVYGQAVAKETGDASDPVSSKRSTSSDRSLVDKLTGIFSF